MAQEVFSDHVLMLTKEGVKYCEEVNGYNRFEEIGSFCVWFWDRADAEHPCLRLRTDQVLEIVTVRGKL